MILSRLRALAGRTRTSDATLHPRELLKAATNVRIAVIALLVAAGCIALTVLQDSARQDSADHRERQLVGVAFEQARLNLSAHLASLAGGFEAPAGRARQELLESARGALAASTGLAAGSLDLVLFGGGRSPAMASAADPARARSALPAIESLAARPGPGSLFSQAAILRIDDRLALVALAAAGPRAAVPLMGAVHWLDDAALADFGHRLGLADLRMLAPRAAPRSGFIASAIVGPESEALGSLAWRRADDRADLRLRALALAAMLAGIGIWMGLISRKRRRQIHDLVGEVEAQVYDVAMRDPLTGLLNRASFKRKLESLVAARGARELIGVVYVDLDRFKQVNDGFGHLKGDELLCAVTERLRDLSPTGLTVARLGGDEFAMIVEDRPTTDAIMALAERACECLGFPFQLGDVEAVIGGSVGVSICPIDGEEHQELLRRADIAMYRAKTGGRSNTIRFDISMDNDVQALRALEADLRHAIERNEMSLAYQPFWASDGQTIVGVEALLRWQHPTRGQVSPAFFVPIAEEAGLIHEMGEWAIATAMRQCKPWGGIILAVNVSPTQFKRPGLQERIKEMLAQTGFEPERLEIEITEGVLMEDAEAAVKFMRGFKEIGVHIALDDFGTGFSSLSYLRRFPFDKLKVDQSFVRALGSGPGTSAIIHSVIALGRALGMTVHAEGVETLEHHIFLRAAGCHHLQGYLFARPLPAAECEALMQARTVRPAMKPMFGNAPPGPALPPARGGADTADADAGPDLGAQLRARVAEMKLALGGAAEAEAALPAWAALADDDAAARADLPKLARR